MNSALSVVSSLASPSAGGCRPHTHRAPRSRSASGSALHCLRGKRPPLARFDRGASEDSPLCAAGRDRLRAVIACLNVANLLVARSAARRKEQAIRTALGGSKLRLLRQHMMESLLICVAGGAIGFFLAVGVLHWFVAVRHDVPRANSIAIDGVVAAFTLGLVILCAAFAGAISSLSMRGDQALQALRESSRGQSAGVARTHLRSVCCRLKWD